MGQLAPFLLVSGAAGAQLVGGFVQSSALREQSRMASMQASLQTQSGVVQERALRAEGEMQAASVLEQMNRDMASAVASAYASGVTPGASTLERIAHHGKRAARDLQRRGRIQGLSARTQAAANAASLQSQAAALRGQSGAALLQGITGAAVSGVTAWEHRPWKSNG